jgi:arginyl-tRNA--protein-N-Asp/Glu arginylyltransferase
MQTAHDATRPLDRPATEYPTCATILDPLHQVSYSCHGLRRCMPCRTCHHETSKHDSPNETKVKKQNKTILDSNSNLAKSMTHDNQTKELTTLFLNLPLAESIDNKSAKFEV